MAKMTIAQLDEATEMAYSYDRYSRSGWRGAIQKLRALGLTDREIQAWMRSKHTRWAGDMSAKNYGQYNGNDVAAYIQKYPTAISAQELQELVAGTDNLKGAE